MCAIICHKKLQNMQNKIVFCLNSCNLSLRHVMTGLETNNYIQQIWKDQKRLWALLRIFNTRFHFIDGFTLQLIYFSFLIPYNKDNYVTHSYIMDHFRVINRFNRFYHVRRCIILNKVTIDYPSILTKKH